jgi:hypothetical protein
MFWKRFNLLSLSALMFGLMLGLMSGGCASDATYQDRANNYCLEKTLEIGFRKQANPWEPGQTGGNETYPNPADVSCFGSSDSES